EFYVAHVTLGEFACRWVKLNPGLERRGTYRFAGSGRHQFEPSSEIRQTTIVQQVGAIYRYIFEYNGRIEDIIGSQGVEFTALQQVQCVGARGVGENLGHFGGRYLRVGYSSGDHVNESLQARQIDKAVIDPVQLIRESRM